MKIAIPSENGKLISTHFGRTRGFVIAEIENSQLVEQEYVENTFTGHAQGLHNDHQSHNHAHHSHLGILSALNDCNVVIAGGMGRRLYDDLLQQGKDIYVTRETDVQRAIDLFIKDQLDNNSESCCEH